MVTTARPASRACSLGAPGIVRHRQGWSPYLASEEPDGGGLSRRPLLRDGGEAASPGPGQQELQRALRGEGSGAGCEQTAAPPASC